MIPLDDTSSPARDAKRDRWGRYLIPDPDTGKSRGWTRATTVAKTLDDSTNLTNWAKRQVAIGVALKPHLAAGIVAGRDDRRRLDELVEAALEAAGGNERRELGTALHRILELVDTGRMAVDEVPDPWGDDVRAYRAALAADGLEVVPELCEAVLLNRPLEVAGTCDRILRDADGRLVVADIKTGTFVAWMAFATQFAIYATSTHLWDPTTETLSAAPDMRQDHALLLHIPAGEGRCEIEALSVPVGMDAALMALEVRRLRQADKRDNVVVARNAKPAPARTVRHDFGAVRAVAARPAVTDEGPMMTPRQVATIKAKVAEIDPQARALLDALAKQAAGVGRPFSIGAGPLLRRWHIYRALLRLAARFGADLCEDHIRATVAVVLPEAGQLGVPLGPAIGSLGLTEAEALVHAALAVVGSDEPAVTSDDTGAVRWAGVGNTAA